MTSLTTRTGTRRLRHGMAALLASTALASQALALDPGDATWLESPGTPWITDASNWSTGSVPVGTATFGASNTTALISVGSLTMGGWTFTPASPGYSFINFGSLTFTGAGINAATGIVAMGNLGTLQFENSSSAGNGTSISNSGTINFNDTSSAGSSSIENFGGINFRNGSTASSAAIENFSGKVVSFSDSSTAGAATILNRGTLSFDNSSTAGTAAITNASGGALVFGSASSAASATIGNAGTVDFTNSSTAGTSTIANSGILNFRDGSTAASATITNNGSGTLSFYNLSTAGAATISNSGSTLFRDLSSAGTSTITNSGFLSFSEIATAGSATITNSGFLDFSNISSTGTATITNSGQFSLSTHDLTGAATVTIQSGGIIHGFGSVGSTTVEAGGTFMAAGGTLRINGNLALSAGSQIYICSCAQTLVTGTATLNGATLVVPLATFQAQNYTFLTALGGVSGTFSLVRTSPLVSVLYGTNDVSVSILAYRVGTALGGAGGSNSRSVGAALDRVIDASGGAPPSYFNPLLTLHGASLGNAMNGLSGEAATGAHASAFTSASTFLGIMLDPMAGARGATAAAPGSSLIQMADTGRTPAARVAAGWSVWTKSFGQAGRTASDAATGAAGTASSLYGVAAGADRLISADTLVGFALAGGGTAYGLGTRGTGSGDFAQLGLYGSTRLGPGYVSAALAYGWNRFDVSRTAGLSPLETYRSAPTVHTFGGRIEAGRRFGDRAFATTPYAAVEAIGASTGGYRESWGPGNTGIFALTYGARTYATARAEAGVRLDSLRAVAQTADLLTFARLAYGFQAGTQRSAEASFQQIATSGFTVFGARASTHTALGSLGLELRLATGTRVTASLDGELGDRHRSLRANAGISHSW